MTEAQLLRRLYEAMDDEEIDAALELTSPDVDWEDVWAGGRVVGHEAVREHWQWLADNFGVKRAVRSVEPRPDGRYDVEIDQTVENHGGMLLSHGPVVHRLEIADGRIARMDLG